MGMGVRFGGVGFGGRSQDLGGSKWEKESHELGGLRGGGSDWEHDMTCGPWEWRSHKTLGEQI